MIATVLDYLGSWENGILVLLSIEHQGVFYEGIFYYTNDKMILNVDSTLEDILGCLIENWLGYLPLMQQIINLVEPYEEIIDTLSLVDPSNLWH